jgi:hypothetical protein
MKIEATYSLPLISVNQFQQVGTIFETGRTTINAVTTVLCTIFFAHKSRSCLA